MQQCWWSGKGISITGTLKGGDHVGNFRVMETPGHASGHISFFREADGVLIAGDVITNMHLLTTLPGLRLPPLSLQPIRTATLHPCKNWPHSIHASSSSGTARCFITQSNSSNGLQKRSVNHMLPEKAIKT